LAGNVIVVVGGCVSMTHVYEVDELRRCASRPAAAPGSS
jgi:hypothetical protein